jgi:glycosyltransferase involved in cell wall biosynthesis
VRIGLVVPGFSADARDWCIPALRDLVAQLALGNDVCVLSLRYPFCSARYELFGAQVIALGGGQKTKLGSVDVWQQALRVLTAEHRRRHFDVLHAFWASETGALTALAGRLLGVPSVVSLAGGELAGLRDIGYGGQLASRERMKVYLALKLANAVTGGSQSILALAAPWLRGRPAQQIRRLPFGVDTTLFAPQAPSGDQPLRLLHVASLTPVKDQATLLRAVARVKQCGVSFVVDIVGSGPLEGHLRELADGLGIAGSVHFLGDIRHEELPPIYRRASVFVLSSRHEAQGMVVLEAAACGVPIVATRVGVAPELSPDAVIVVPTGDADALAEAIVDLLRSPQRRATMGEAGPAHIAAQFDLPACTSRFYDLYCTLAAESVP